MIKILYGVNKDGNYNYLKANGHAEYDIQGKDLICSAVSSIIVGFMNALDEFDNIEFKQLTNEYEIKINNDSNVIQNYFNLVLTQLKTIEESYSQFIKIERK